MRIVNADMNAYYAQRASTYEQTYARPEYLDDLETLENNLCEALDGHNVLELACGTGYWTEQYAPYAASVMATDINPDMLAIAQRKDYSEADVQFALADAFDLKFKSKFTSCFAGFLWSHIPRQNQSKLLDSMREKVGKDGLLVMMDHTYVEDINTPIARTDQEGNTYQIRTLPNGERFEVLKNFPTDSALKKKLTSVMKEIRVLRLPHFWMLTARFK